MRHLALTALMVAAVESCHYSRGRYFQIQNIGQLQLKEMTINQIWKNIGYPFEVRRYGSHGHKGRFYYYHFSHRKAFDTLELELTQGKLAAFIHYSDRHSLPDEKIDKLRLGIARDEVEKIMGSPNGRAVLPSKLFHERMESFASFSYPGEKAEAWAYTQGRRGQSQFIMIVFAPNGNLVDYAFSFEAP